jgi:glycosyltransferase involved in cell wall biosynthesis
MKKALTLSIVIPVYNEEHHLGDCLNAIATQTVKPYEVIVVDNNSTDKTVEIATKYPFVTIVKEPVQGRTAARNKGFNTATGDIIGRIDADSVLLPNWVERILHDFQDPSVSGVTGLGKTYVILGLRNWYTTFWSRVYFWTVHSLYRAMTMWGANMAIRRSKWEEIKHDVAPDGTFVHEDQDISFVLIGYGGRIIQDNKLLIITGGVSYLYWPKFWWYFKKTFHMRKYHFRRGTLKNVPQLRLRFWSTLPGAIVGWFFTGIFMIYAFLSWPILAVLMRYSKNALKKYR